MILSCLPELFHTVQMAEKCGPQSMLSVMVSVIISSYYFAD